MTAINLSSLSDEDLGRMVRASLLSVKVDDIKEAQAEQVKTAIAVDLAAEGYAKKVKLIAKTLGISKKEARTRLEAALNG